MSTQTPEQRTDASFALFALMAKQAQQAEGMSTAFQQQRQALLRDHADDLMIQAAVWRMKQSEVRARELAAELKEGRGRGKQRRHGLRHYCPGPKVVAFVEDTHGLGDASFFFLGLLPQWIAEFKTVSKLWAYCGLHVVNGRAPRRKKGVKSNWSAELKAIAIVRMAEPCMKVGGPYRAVYDARRDHTTPMWADEHEDKPAVLAAPDCPTCIEATADGENGSCRLLGGEHWAKWHRHKDAMRITAKEILKDLWRVSRGHEPLFGGVDQTRNDTLSSTEDPSAAA